MPIAGSARKSGPTSGRRNARVAGGLGLLSLSVFAAGTTLPLLLAPSPTGLDDLLGLWIASALLVLFAGAAALTGAVVLLFRHRAAPAIAGVALCAVAALLSLVAGAPIFALLPSLVALVLLRSLWGAAGGPDTSSGRRP